MTGYPEHNFPRFNEVATLLRVSGYEVDNPADNGVIDGFEWEDYLKLDLHNVIDAHGIATLENWRKSKGARFEVRVAKALGIPVKPFREWLRDAAVLNFKLHELVRA